MEPIKAPAVRIQPKRQRAGATPSSPCGVIVFTSLDGTLLDAKTFDAGPSRAAVQRLHAAGIPVVPVSVMTLEEIAPLAADLDLRHAMIVEAGGAIVRWTDGHWEAEPCGPPAETLLDIVRDIEERSGSRLRVYSVLPESEAAEVSGRSGEMLQASIHRCFTEPFVIEEGDLEAVSREAASMGYAIRRGRRFLHLCRDCDEGAAFTRLKAEMECETSVALGDAAIDLEFLSRADIPIIIPGPDGEADPELLAQLPNARIASAPGPLGWATAVDDVLASFGRSNAATAMPA
jgi:mannosyl-3-phosphoglycerate phosphatase